MAEYLIQDKTLIAIANAIRSKTGSTETIYTKDMATHIYNIETGSNLKCPILDETYPQSVSINATESASFEVRITEDGLPNSYTYQWYYNGNAVSGATSKTYIVNTTKNDGGTHLIWCEVINDAGIVTSSTASLTVNDSLFRTPEFTYNGTYTLTDDSGTAVSRGVLCDNWRLTFKTGGTLEFTSLNSAANGVDVFCVGGGGGGCGGYPVTHGSDDDPDQYTNYHNGRGGSGGGVTTTRDVTISSTSISVVIGAGGTAGPAGQSYGSGSGGKSSFLSVSASGGTAQGASGKNAYAFGESGGTVYSKAGATNTGGTGAAGTANTGNGGGGGACTKSKRYAGGKGGSGVVIIRNKR